MTNPDGTQAGQPAQAATPLESAASWQLDAQGSSVAFSHKTIWGLVTVRGTFSDLSGSAEILADGSARGRLVIGAASVDTKHAKRDKHLRSAELLKADDHPQIVAEIGKVARDGDKNAQVEGTLTVAGTTRPLTFTAQLTEDTPQAITLRAETQVNRADFGVDWNQLGMVTGNAAVSVVARFTSPAAP